MWVWIGIIVLSAFWYGVGYVVGRLQGVDAERLRVKVIFDRAFQVVQSGALRIVYGAVLRDFPLEGLRPLLEESVRMKHVERMERERGDATRR
jgi:hypothetical protein